MVVRQLMIFLLKGGCKNIPVITCNYYYYHVNCV